MQWPVTRRSTGRDPQLPGLHRPGQRGDRRPRLGGDGKCLVWSADCLYCDQITAWVGGLTMEGGYCDSAAQPDQCKDAVQFLIPLALPLLASQPRDWVDQVGEAAGHTWRHKRFEQPSWKYPVIMYRMLSSSVSSGAPARVRTGRAMSARREPRRWDSSPPRRKPPRHRRRSSSPR